ncbi:MAG: CPBP family intramembrane glutamic endopeptidase [Blastocatellia bacterium]
MVDQLATTEACRGCGVLLNNDELQDHGLCAACAKAGAFEASPDVQFDSVAANPFDLAPVPGPPVVPDPDNPTWGPPTGISAWIFSVAAIIVIPVIAVIAWYFIQSGRGAAVPNIAAKDELLDWLKSPPLLLVQVLSTIVAHAITIAGCWVVVTMLGTRPFWASLGWHWSGHSKTGLKLMLWGLAIGFGPLSIAILARLISTRFEVIPLERLYPIAFLATATGLAMAWRKMEPAVTTREEQVAPLLYWLVLSASIIVTLIGVTQMLSRFLPQSEENPFTELLKSSQQVRVAMAVLATFSAPLVEETVYRGVLFSGLRKKLGMVTTVVIVTVMFAGVHVLQYLGAWVSVAGLTLLSLALTIIRAKTKSILPCVLIHTANNAFFSVLILLNRAT